LDSLADKDDADSNDDITTNAGVWHKPKWR
jgi:hypothetical protein